MQRVEVFDIQRYCIHDGPGIRTTVFLKGCNLGCAWCHNPESQKYAPQLLFYSEKCLFEQQGEACLCKICARICPQYVHKFTDGRHVVERKNCLHCGKCVECCPSNALEISGESKSIPEIMGEILRDKEFYAASGGGVTFSGGEPLLQFESLRMLLPECQLNGIHTAVESACNVPVEWLNEVLDNIDLMICDIKAVTPALHKEGTGCTNDRILNNIRHLLTGTDKPVWIRIPVISGFNDNKTEFTGIARFIRSCLEVRGVGGGDSNLERVELLPFHDIGKNKYRALGMEYSYGNSKSPSDGHMMELKQVLRENGVNCVV